VALARELLERQPSAAIVALTNSRWADVEAWFTARRSSHYFYKGDVTAEEFPTLLRNKVLGATRLPESLIVDGADAASALALKHFLQNGLRLPEPLLLSEQPKLGMSYVKKVEYYAQKADLFFIFLTPEDVPPEGAAAQDVAARNGYLLGMLKGREGRVFLLYKGGVRLPPFFDGVVTLDITDGINSVAEQIRRELRGLLPE
jgi:predicted nucleotide-binding protein